MHKCSRKTKFNLSEFANANAVLFVCSRGFCTAPLLLLVLLTQRRGIARISLDFGSIVGLFGSIFTPATRQITCLFIRLVFDIENNL